MRNLIVFIVALAIAILAATSGLAQSPLTLDEAYERAMQGNREVVASELDRQASEFSVSEALGYYLPSLTISEIYMQSNNPVLAFATDLLQHEFSLQEFQMSDPNEPGTVINHITRFSLQQPIFAGGKITTGIYQARQMQHAAGFTSEQARRDAAYQVSEAFYNTLRAQKYTVLLEQVKRTMDEHRRTAGDYMNAGMALDRDVLQAEVYVAQADMNATEAEANRRMALSHLNFLMGDALDRNWTLTEPGRPIECPIGEPGEIREQATANRNDLLAMRHKVKVAEAQKMQSATGFLPQIGFQGEILYHDEDDFFGNQGEDWTMMVVAQWNLFNGFRDTSATMRAVREAKAAKTRLAMMEEGIALEVMQKQSAFTVAEKKLQMAKIESIRADRNLAIEKDRFDKGLVKISDVLDAQTEYDQARTKLLDAQYDNVLSRLALRHAAGLWPCGPSETGTEEE